MWLITIIVVGCILGVIMLYYLDFYWRRRPNLIKLLQLNWGKEHYKAYDYNEFEDIKIYWALKQNKEGVGQADGYIDSITWNDLDMDEVFKKINHTESSIGESYLYDQLHCLQFEAKNLQTFEQLIQTMDRNEKIRLRIQEYLNHFGKRAVNRIPMYLLKIEEKAVHYKSWYTILGILPIIGLLGVFINVKVGAIFTALAVLMNGTIYYRYTPNLLNEMHILGDIRQMVSIAKKMSNLKEMELQDVCDGLKEDCGKLESILGLEAGFFLNTNTDLGILQEYIGIITLSQCRIYSKLMAVLKQENEAVQHIYETLGRLDASIAVASYRRSIESWTTPEWEQGKSIQVEEMYHPLINKPITNTVTFDQNVIITGSNASGKSTFVKALAINGILAQTIHTALASRFKVPMSYYMTSMAITDNILMSESYYIAEIRSLKRIIDLMEHYPSCICFIDEILKGTNTIERIAASVSILKYLALKNCWSFVASHDIEITEMLEGNYDNFHFREVIEDFEIKFDYKIHRGKSQTRNAIKLLEMMDYNQEIIEGANQLATHFDQHRTWLKL